MRKLTATRHPKIKTIWEVQLDGKEVALIADRSVNWVPNRWEWEFESGLGGLGIYTQEVRDAMDLLVLAVQRIKPKVVGSVASTEF